MMSIPARGSWLAFALTLLGVLSAAAAPSDRPGLETAARLEALKPVYQRLKTDLEFQSLRRQLVGKLDDRAAVDRYLQFLPLSPLEMLRLERLATGRDLPVPRIVERWHRRWIELHETKARRLYGDATVRQLLEGRVDSAPEAPSTLAATVVGTNRNPAANGAETPEDYQGETHVAVDPANPSRIVVAANTADARNRSCGPGSVQAIFHSADGGASWGYSCPPGEAGYPITFFGLSSCAAQGGVLFGSDPAVYWDAQGNAYLQYLLACFNVDIDTRLVVARSGDGGASWSAHGVIANEWADKQFAAVDLHPTSPFFGRQYSCWKNGAEENHVSWSADGGTTWNAVDTPDDPATIESDYACDVTVAQDGTVHLGLWSYCFRGCSGMRLLHARSLDGGLSWSPVTLVFDLVGSGLTYSATAQDQRAINAFGTITVDDSTSACQGTLAMSFTDFPGNVANAANVYVARSLDGGATWLAPQRINDDGLAVSTQFHPAIAFDPTNGHLLAAWHDTRNDPTHRAVDVYLARSLDCGASFEPNLRVTQPSAEFNNAGLSSSTLNSAANPLGNYNQYGDYLGLDAFGGKAFVAWTDSRHFFPGATADPQKENVGFAAVELSAPAGPVCGNGVLEGGEVCDGSLLGGASCSSQGFTGGSLACNASCTALDTSACTLTATFTSLAPEDGWLRESSETSGTANTLAATGTGTFALRAGDDSADREYRSIVSFDTSPLPATAVVESAQLRLQRGGVAGTSPFATHGPLVADLVTGSFGGNAALANGDFAAVATASACVSLSEPTANGSWAEGFLSAAGRAGIDPNGRTQLRLRFTADDNDDNGADYLGFYGGEEATVSRRPQLVVVYRP
jgi:hypothetical protein